MRSACTRCMLMHADRVTVRNGVAHPYGVVFDESSRRASIVAAENTAGVKEVHDCIYLVEAAWNDSRKM